MSHGSTQRDPSGAHETRGEASARPRLDPLVVRTARLLFQLYSELPVDYLDPSLEERIAEWELRLPDLHPLDRADIVG